MKNEGHEILIVEDSPTEIEQLKHTLDKHGYNVATAYNGKEALSYLSGHKPQVVISDIVMPEMDGYELCKEIKSGESTMDIPVILLTSLSRPEDVLEGISCGANNFITKPYREDYLISHIEQILVNRKLVKNERVRVGVEIIFGGKRHLITAGQQQMFTLLISTYEAAVQRNNELKKLNEHLEELVIERTKELSAENAIRKRAENQVKRLNRIYALQSDISQATVRIHDINKLLKEICTIAINKGKFQSAWIGIVNNRTKKIMNSATAGLTNDLIEVSQNQNLITKVIRSGKHFISNNINDDTSINGIWKQNSLSLGFRSFAVLPLIVHEKLIGGFCIYSNEVDFFDDPEISLLDEMANDISFALEYIQKEFERKRAEEEIISQKNRFAQLFENSPIAISLLNDQDKIVHINESFSALFDYYIEEIKGKSLNDLIIPPEFLEEAKSYSDQNRAGDQINKEGYRKKKDGSCVPVQIIGVPITVDDRTIGSYSMYVDLTQRKKAEEELIKAKEKAEEMNRLKNYFLSNMSHELRTPLVPILGFTELLQQEIKDEKHLEFVNQIMEGGQRLNNTLNAILEFSKLESEKMVMNLSPLNLAEEITKNIESIKPKAQSKNLFLKTEMHDKYLKVNIDTELFSHVLFHIISNGIKFTKEGGVLVTLHHKKEQDCEWAVTQVIDTGIGIPKENIDKIFGAFRQASEGHSRNYEGTGLGLTISQRIIEMLNGKIQVESEVGIGSVFSIWLPAVLDESQIKIKVEEKRRTTVIDSPTMKEKGLKKVLLVEDNLSNRLFINRCLSTYVRIIEAEDGISGVTMASKEHFDLILMDINLSSGIDGIDAMHQIKKLPGYAGVPIVAVTAFAMSTDKERFLSEGFDDYLAKPFTKDILISLVEKTFVKAKK